MSQVWRVLQVVAAYKCAAVRLVVLVTKFKDAQLWITKRLKVWYNRPATTGCHLVYVSTNFGLHGVGAE